MHFSLCILDRILAQLMPENFADFLFSLGKTCKCIQNQHHLHLLMKIKIQAETTILFNRT